MELDVIINFGTYYLRVSTPLNYSGKICGLLGDCNGNSNDDFKYKNGTVISDPLTLGIEYRSPTSGLECNYTRPVNKSLECDDEERVRGESFCSYLTDVVGSYNNCHVVISPLPSFNNCVTEYCRRDDNLKGVCGVIQDYAYQCRASGFSVGLPPPECSEHTY